MWLCGEFSSLKVSKNKCVHAHVSDQGIMFSLQISVPCISYTDDAV